MMQDSEVFYIVGVGRSGTTLLMSMLNAHPKIGTPPETHFITSHVLEHESISLDECRARLAVDRRFERLGLDLNRVLDSFRGTDGPISMRAVFREMLQVWKDQKAVDLIGDKAPRYVEILPILHATTPGAAVLHLIRDPRSVYLSRTKAAWSAGRKSWRHLLAYSAQYEEGRLRGPEMFGQRYLEVFYEQLISSPKRVLTDICRFLGVDFDPVMLQFSESASEIISEDEWQWKREAAGPLLQENAGKWQAELSRLEIGTIESACRAPFRDGFYDLTGASPGLLGSATAQLVRSMTKLYRTYLHVRSQRLLREWR